LTLPTSVTTTPGLRKGRICRANSRIWKGRAEDDQVGALDRLLHICVANWATPAAGIRHAFRAADKSMHPGGQLALPDGQSEGAAQKAGAD